MLLYSQLQQVLIRNPPGPAISHLGQELSFPELRRRVGQLSFLYQKELGEDARVALLASPSPAFLAGFLAFTNIRAVAIPLDPGASLAELARWIKESDATHLAVTADRLSAARELLRGERLSLPVIEIERKQGGEFDQTFAPRPENTPRDHEPALVFRTAGVTEEPRLVTYTVRGLHHAAQALKTIYQAAPGERLCTTLPWSHPFAFLHGALFPVLTGLTCVTDPGKEGAELLQRLRDDKVTRLLLTAPGARQFLKDAAAGGRPPALRSLVVGPGATPGELTELRREAAAISLPILRAYGQSESAWAVAVEDGTGSRVPPGIKMKVLDPQGDELVGKKGIRRVGQLAISGPSLMSGYHISGSREDAERATKQVIRGTWLYTGDVAELTGESDTLRVRWAGRRADLLELRNSAAAADPYVAPDACDAILRAIPGVRDAAGFVLLDHRNRPQLAAVVVLEEGVPPRAEELLGACKSRLPAFQCPVGIVFAEFIPRGRLGGAVNRGRLSRQFHGTNLERPPTPVAEAEIAAPPPGFTACELVDLLVDVPLPLMIHAFFKGRMIPFRPAGTRIDRPLYDRLELKAARHLYVRDTELALLQEWRRQHDPDASGPAARARAPGLEQARRQAHRDLLEMFTLTNPDEIAAQAVATSRRLIEEVTKGGFAARPLAELRAYSKGTVDHSINVSVLAAYLALHLGYSHQGILTHIGTGALLHDLGRARLALEGGDSAEGEEKQGSLHPEVGLAALGPEGSVPREVRMIVAQHHELHDGSGYPKGLKGGQIYDLARIVTIADIFENLVSRATDEPDPLTRYRNALVKLEAEYAKKLDPYKLEKATRVLELTLN